MLWADLGAADTSLRAAETQQSASWRVGASSADDPTRAAYAAFRSVAERALGRTAVAAGLAAAPNAGTEGAEEGGGAAAGATGAAGAAAGAREPESPRGGAGRDPGSAALGMLGEMGMGLRGSRVAGAAPGGLPAALRALRAAAALGNATAQHTLGFLHGGGLLGLARNDGVAALHGTY